MLRWDQSSMQKHLWDEPKRQWCPPRPIVVVKINKEIKSCQDKYSAAGLSNLTCSFCPEQVVQESQNHIKALGQRVAGRCRCDPPDSPAAHTASPHRQAAPLTGPSEGRESRQGTFLAAFLLSCSSSCCALGKCGAITSWNMPPVVGISLPVPPSLHTEHDTLCGKYSFGQFGTSVCYQRYSHPKSKTALYKLLRRKANSIPAQVPS